MQDEALRELHVLRARAYGPSADIHEDADALRRLRELEGLSRPPLVTDTHEMDDAHEMDVESDRRDGRSVPSPVASAQAESVRAEPAADAPAATAPSDPPAPARGDRRRRRLLPWLWVASLVVVAALAAGMTLTTVQVVSRDVDARQIATLQPDPAFSWPGFFGSESEGGQGFQEFFGLRAVAGDGPLFGTSGGPCLTIAHSADIVDPEATSFSGPMYYGCGAGAFPATIQLVVSSEMPEPLRDRFADGTALQFVLDGSRVGVFSDAE